VQRRSEMGARRPKLWSNSVVCRESSCLRRKPHVLRFFALSPCLPKTHLTFLRCFLCVFERTPLFYILLRYVVLRIDFYGRQECSEARRDSFPWSKSRLPEASKYKQSVLCSIVEITDDQKKVRKKNDFESEFLLTFGNCVTAVCKKNTFAPGHSYSGNLHDPNIWMVSLSVYLRTIDSDWIKDENFFTAASFFSLQMDCCLLPPEWSQWRGKFCVFPSLLRKYSVITLLFHLGKLRQVRLIFL
jgi:hypothetical protein